MMRRVTWAVALLLVTSGIAFADDIDVQGRLEPGDQTLPEGQYYDAYPVELVAGEPVRIEIMGMAMMPTLLIYNATSELVHRNMGTWSPSGYGYEEQWQPEASSAHWIVVTQSWRDTTEYRLKVTFPQ